VYKRQEIPLVANVLAAPVSDPVQIKKLLVEQVTGRVRWRESIKFMADQGIGTVLEIGAGKVLTGLARRIDRSLTGRAINTPGDIELLLESKD
jgi:[acyl-carrier-protein] S-malonyltransferase